MRPKLLLVVHEMHPSLNSFPLCCCLLLSTLTRLGLISHQELVLSFPGSSTHTVPSAFPWLFLLLIHASAHIWNISSWLLALLTLSIRLPHVILLHVTFCSVYFLMSTKHPSLFAYLLLLGPPLDS